MASDNVEFLMEEIEESLKLLVDKDDEEALRKVLDVLRGTGSLNNEDWSGIVIPALISPVGNTYPAIPGIINPVGAPMANLKNITLKAPKSLAQSLTIAKYVKSYGRSNGIVKTTSNYKNYGKSSK